MENNFLVQVILRLNNMLVKINGGLVVINSLFMLCENEESMDTNRNHNIVFNVMLDNNLWLVVRSQQHTSTILPKLDKTSTKFEVMVF